MPASSVCKATMEEHRPNQNIYKISRSIKRRDSSLYNALCSIYEDSIFVGEISQLWPDLPLVANLRCGLWYSPNFHTNCYFKSTDGHTNNLSFSTARLNLHVALLAGILSSSRWLIVCIFLLESFCHKLIVKYFDFWVVR